MSASAIAFHDELSRARAVAAERRKALEEAPELTAEQILDGFKRELRSVAVEGFGKVYYYYPMSVAEHLELREKIGDGDETTAAKMVQAIIAFARNGDGSLKFKPEHASALLQAPDTSVLKLAALVVHSHGFSIASAEKK